MILGLASFGERRTEVDRFELPGLAHVVGGLLGGLALAITAWLVGTPIRTLFGESTGRVLVGCVAVLAVLADLHIVRWTDHPRQVNPHWLERLGPRRAFFYYGMIFGFGWITFKPSAIFYVIVALLAFVAPLGTALAIGAAFGVAHTAVPVVGARWPQQGPIVLYRGRYVEGLWRHAGAVLAVGVAVVTAGVVAF